MQSIISSNIQRRATRVVAKSGIRPQNIAHVLWVVLPNALLQVISCSLQCQDSLVRLHLLYGPLMTGVYIMHIGAATERRSVALSVPVHFSKIQMADVPWRLCYNASQSVESRTRLATGQKSEMQLTCNKTAPGDASSFPKAHKVTAMC